MIRCKNTSSLSADGWRLCWSNILCLQSW